MAAHTTVTGPPKGSNFQPPPPPRKEIYDLIKDEKQFSLYVQALTRLAETKETVSISHYQVGGIHGLPYIRWEDAGDKDPAGAWKGYCFHGSVLFPTWHRPYVSLYEQLLNKHARDIAKDMSDDWQRSADALRQPYWDWTMHGVPPPEVIEYKTLSILHPDGMRKINNPLLNYTFQSPLDKTTFGKFAQWSKTVRKPDVDSDDGKRISMEEWKAELNGNLHCTQVQVYELLLFARDWNTFSHHRKDEHTYSRTPVSSLEHIHDKIHNIIGGNGFMGDSSVAGFDPIFFLHHCNVDRLLAIWQAIHSDVWVSDGVAKDGGNWTQAEGTAVNSTTQLAPFWSPPDDSGTVWWTSDQARRWETLNYTYPEFIRGFSESPTEIEIVKKVLKLYGGKADAATSGEATGVDVNFYDWKAGVEVKQFAIGSSFNICVFLFAPGADTSTISDTDSTGWFSSPFFAGQTTVFVNGVGRASCGNCQAQVDANAVIEGFIPLNYMIEAANGNLKPHEGNDNEVLEYLKKNITWKVCKAGGEVVPVSSIPSLKVTVYSMSWSVPNTSAEGFLRFSGYRNVRPRQEVTSGKVGGFEG